MKKSITRENKFKVADQIKIHLLSLAGFIAILAMIYASYFLAGQLLSFILSKTGKSIGNASYFIRIILGLLFLHVLFHLAGRAARLKRGGAIKRNSGYDRFENGRRSLQAQARYNLLEDFGLALDRIAQGDFDVFFEPADDFFRKQMLNDLAARFNHMAGQLKSMEVMRQDFISNVSHEIQSPITSIKGFAVLLKNESLPEEERLQYIRIIETECDRLSKLSSNLLKLSALDSGAAVINASKFNIVRQLRNSALSLEPLWREKDLQIEITGEEAELKADQELLKQVWINLLSNSIKFTPSGGKITMDVSKDNENITITLTDDGAGIAPDDQPFIFERFFRADKSRRRDECGNGLGLSIVKKIIDMHKGSIKVSSGLGEGTVFTVSLPEERIVPG